MGNGFAHARMACQMRGEPAYLGAGQFHQRRGEGAGQHVFGRALGDDASGVHE